MYHCCFSLQSSVKDKGKTVILVDTREISSSQVGFCFMRYQSHSNQLLPVLLFTQPSLVPFWFLTCSVWCLILRLSLVLSDRFRLQWACSAGLFLHYAVLPYCTLPIPPSNLPWEASLYLSQPLFTPSCLSWPAAQHVVWTHHTFENTLNTEAHYFVTFEAPFVNVFAFCLVLFESLLVVNWCWSYLFTDICRSLQVVSILRLKHNIKAEVCQLTSCDYIVSNRMAVKRKSVSGKLIDFWYLTIRLRVRVFYEQIVNEAQPSRLSFVKNKGE